MTVWLDWLGAARNLFEALLPRSQGNVAIALPIVQQFGVSASWIIAVLALAVVMYVLAGRRIAGRNAAGIVIGVGLMIYLLSATLVWPHYLILALPLVIALLSVEESIIRRALALFALTLLAVDPWRVMVGFQTTTGESTAVWLGLIVLFATAIWRLAAGQRETRASPA